MPALGTMAGVAKLNAPSTDPAPPERADELKGCPYWIGDALGAELMVEASLLNVRIAPTLIVEPPVWLTTTSYVPACTARTSGIAKLDAVAPSMGTPPLRH